MKVSIRDQRNGNWYWISRTVYQDYAPKIGAIGLALYNAYASYSFDTQKVFPSLTTISKKLGITRPTVVKYNEILIKNKLIRIHKQKGNVNIITLLRVEVVNEVYGGSKRGLPVVVNEVYPNKKKGIIRKNNTVARKRDDHNLNPSFGISQSNNGQNQFDINCTNRLIKILQAKRKIMRRVNTDSWIRQFRKLRVDDEVEKRKIKNVLIWYGQHIGEKYMIEAYSAKTFRDRFDKIANKMNQSQDPKRKKDYKPGDPEDDFKTTTTRWVTKDGKKRSRVVIDES